MPEERTVTEKLDRVFLEVRCRIIDIAAALDRVQRDDGENRLGKDPRMQQIKEAIGVLIDGLPDRARRVQMVFSDPYAQEWRGSSGAPQA